MNPIFQTFLDTMVNDDGSGTTGDLMTKSWWTDFVGRVDSVISLSGLSVDQDQTFYVSGSSGSDDDGDGSLTLPWATLAYAVSNLQTYRITPGGSCTLQLDDGAYTLTASLTDMPDGLVIKGKNTLLRQVTSVQSSSGTSGDYAIILNMFDTSSIAVGDECAIIDATGGTCPEALVGVYPITNVDTTNSRITIASVATGTLPSGLADLPSGLVEATAHIYKTRLSASGVSCVTANTDISLQDIALLGDETADTYAVAPDRASVTLTNVSLRGFGAGGILCESDANVQGDGVYISNCGDIGVKCASGSTVEIEALWISRMMSQALYCEYYGTIIAPEMWTYDVGTGIYCCHSGTVSAINADILNGYCGVICRSQGAVTITSTTISNHETYGMLIEDGASVSAQMTSINNNSIFSPTNGHILAQYNTYLDVSNATIQGTVSLTAFCYTFVKAFNTAFLGSTVPAIDTEGNSGSYIRPALN